MVFFFFFYFFLGGVAMVLQHRYFIQKNIRYKYHMQSWIWIWYALITSCSDHYNTDDVWNPSLPKAVIGLSRCNRSLDPAKFGRKKKRQKVNKAQQEQPCRKQPSQTSLLCYVMLCYVMLCYVMLCYVMLCYVMLCYVMLCYVMLCYVMLCYNNMVIKLKFKWHTGQYSSNFNLYIKIWE